MKFSIHRYHHIVILLLLSVSGISQAETYVDENLPDPAHEYARLAVYFADKQFRRKLDWSVQSIRKVDGILAKLNQALAKEAPDEKTLMLYAKAFGSYVGEVIHLQHGGYWDKLTLRAITPQKKFLTFEPWRWAEERIKEGPDRNIWQRYLQHYGVEKRMQDNSIKLVPLKP